MAYTKRWIMATFILCFLVIIAGGIVRTTQSGMGCPDWPKCFGKWIPPLSAAELPADFEKYLGKQDIDHSFNAFHTWIEYFNRLLGALLGVFAIFQCILLYSRRKLQKKTYRISLLFLATVILTGLIGAIVVKLNLAHVSISLHLFLAFLLIQIELAVLLSINNNLFALAIDTRMKKMVAGFLVVLICQIILGTLVRMHVDDVSKWTNYQHRETWLFGSAVAVPVHRTFSWVVLLYVLFLNWVFRNVEAWRKKLLALLGIVSLSVITGLVLYFLDMPAIAQPIHLLLATFALTQVVYILLRSDSNLGLTRN